MKTPEEWYDILAKRTQGEGWMEPYKYRIQQLLREMQDEARIQGRKESKQWIDEPVV